LVQQGFVDFNGVEVTGNTGISATGAVSIQDDFLNTSGPTISLIAGPGNVTITDDKCLSAGQAFTYQWSLASMPIGSKATLNVATSSITGGTGAISFLPDSGVFRVPRPPSRSHRQHDRRRHQRVGQRCRHRQSQIQRVHDQEKLGERQHLRYRRRLHRRQHRSRRRHHRRQPLPARRRIISTPTTFLCPTTTSYGEIEP